MSVLEFEAFAVPGPDRFGPLVPVEHRGPGDELEYHAPALSRAGMLQLTEDLEAAGDALRERPVREIASALGRVGERFLSEDDELRRQALHYLPSSAGISTEMAREVLDGMARDWTPDRLERLLDAEFSDAGVLDAPAVVDGRTVAAIGPRLCIQIVSGSVPGVTVTALVRSLLVKAATLIKPGLGDVVLPVLFARGLRDEDEALAEALAVLYWPGGAASWEKDVISAADLVVAYGSDRSVGDVRAMTAPTTRFLGYHHRAAYAAVARDALTVADAGRVAGEVAMAVAIFDQRGCVCPGTVFVEEGGEVEPSAFAEAVAAALSELEGRLPSGRLDEAEAARIQQVRGNAELRAATSASSVFHGGADAPWTVIFEPGELAENASVGRTVLIRPLGDASTLGAELASDAAHLQTIGFAGFADRLNGLAAEWGRVGASRIIPIRDMSFPPPWWHHDGRGPLRDLVRWVEIDEG